MGRKLAAYLADAGFAPVGVRVYTVTSGDFGMKGLLDLTTGFKFQQLADQDKETAMRERAEIYRLLDHPNAWGFTGVFVATGVKPAG